MTGSVTTMAHGAIGVFDSGVGGLSVLRHIRQTLPSEPLVYVSDAGFAPYGDKSEAFVLARSLVIAEFLIDSGAKALVIACNTATAASIHAIRLRYPAIPVVGVEPGLKPAAVISATRIVGVLATYRTLASDRFLRLQKQIEVATGVRFLLQPCPGLADQIERGALRSPVTARLVDSFVHPLLEKKADALVLGCTHYPFVLPLIHSAIVHCPAGIDPISIHIIDTGAAVARQLATVLQHGELLHAVDAAGSVAAFTTGSCGKLSQAMKKLLAVSVPTMALTAPAADQQPALF